MTSNQTRSSVYCLVWTCSSIFVGSRARSDSKELLCFIIAFEKFYIRYIPKNFGFRWNLVNKFAYYYFSHFPSIISKNDAFFSISKNDFGVGFSLLVLAFFQTRFDRVEPDLLYVVGEAIFNCYHWVKNGLMMCSIRCVWPFRSEYSGCWTK